ncbi:MAG: transcription antitermination factor NusB [Aggregatilineales bacterium]
MNNYTPLTSPNFESGDVVKTEDIAHERLKSDRSAARYMALQVLYEVDSTGHQVGVVLNEQLLLREFNLDLLEMEHIDLEITEMLEQIVTGVIKHLELIDQVIQKYATEWPLNQVATIDRNILRIAVYEFAIGRRVNPAIAIDEAVRLAKWFGADGSPRFVNGVLGAITSDLDTVKKMLGNIES